MKELSRIASAVQASTTMAIDAMFKQMKADGVDVIGFGAGEPDFNTPDNIKAAGIAAIEQNITRYTPAAGTVELRQAVCGRMKADYGLEYKPSQVVVSSGAKHLVYLALRAVVNPGDEVILPAPYWVSYIELIKMVGGVPVVVTATEAEHFKLTAEKLSAAITPRTKAILLNNPIQPNRHDVQTGRSWEAHRHSVCAGQDIYVISDEIYCLPGLRRRVPSPAFASISADVKERTILVNGVSKAYASDRLAHRLRLAPTTSGRQGDGQLPQPLHRLSSVHLPEGRRCGPLTASQARCGGHAPGLSSSRRDYIVERMNSHPAASSCIQPRRGVLCDDEPGAAHRPGPFTGVRSSGDDVIRLTLFLKYGQVAVVPGYWLRSAHFCPLVLRHFHGEHQRGPGPAGSVS
ncbi:MAG: aminotransferase class I/II-fold pyridoxal phosphate-dependent enzyme [Flavonifractor plautii]